MAAGLDVGIDANRSRGPDSKTRRFRCEQIEFGRRFHVKEQDARAKRLADFFARFAHAGKNDPAARHANAPQAVEFPSGNDIESAAHRGKHAQNAQIRIGFDGVTDRVRERSERGVHPAIGLLDARAAVEISGRPELLRDLLHGNAFAKQARFSVGKSRSIAHRIGHTWRSSNSRVGNGRAHLTFITTRVRSSVMAPPWVYSCTSSRMRSASSAEVKCVLSASRFFNRSVPKNFPSRLLASVIPSE